MSNSLKALQMTHEIFDRALIRDRRRRVAHFDGGADFLLRLVANDLTERVGGILRRFDTALDLGAHHGLLSRRLERLDNIGQVIALESAPGLLAQCQGLKILCDEEFLPIKPQSIDLITSGLVLQQVNDLPGTLLQIKDALRPDGLFLGVALGGQTLHELRTSFMKAEMEIEGGSSPRVAPFADVRALGALLQRAGFALPVVDSHIVKVNYPDPIALMKELRAMGWANALIERRKSFLRRETLMRACEIYTAEFTAENGRVSASFELITLTGWAPHASQQQPLRPGSATQRLADALGVEEMGTGDKAGFPNKK